MPATQVKRCSNNKPFPLEVRIAGCVVPPCDVVKGSVQIFEIDFAVDKFITKLTTRVKATTLGIITVPYELPEDVAAVCPNLKYGAYCPLYPTEDVTYLFQFPVGEYPEIGVKIEIYLEDQDNETATCFVCDIKVKKGPGSKVYELNYLD
ncbi:NPC intracellular cholesterol transporter 2 homolog a [Drosophila grimshawi]|uniref:GH14070 n=1 Tax=Drosophila grimshawi TaxID=7222 RepID=B4JY77_DROGR|nr:NPC intracellular cholesterol transporter 2 homolog a [Drosophila grimshawi]EDV90639.1 GH14070 [Drosophila grimshawi]